MYKNTAFLERSSERSSVDAYANFVGSLDWSYWCTFTTPYELTLKSARRLMDRFHDRLCEKIGRNRLFWVAEPFDCRDGYHTHGLLYVDSNAPDKQSEWEALNESFQIVQGRENHGKRGRPRILRYNGKGASKYCAKYIQKARCDYDLLFSS